MAEKILNTRIQLKYDSYTNWSTNNPELKSGEIAIAYLATSAATTPTTPDNGKHPIMFKVGPGKFNDLPWSSALAADVYGWAKEDKLTITSEGDGNVIGSIAWDASLNNGKGGIKCVTASIATKKQFEEMQATFDALNAQVATMYSNEAIDSAIASAKQEALTAAATAKSEAIAAAAADAETKANTAKETAEATAAAALASAKTELEGKIDTDLAALETALDSRLDTLEGINHDLFATKEDVAKDKAALEESIAGVSGVANAAKARIDAFMDTTGLTDTMDSLLDIKAWMDGEGVVATELTEAIAAEAKLREDADSALSDRITSLENNDGDYATTSDVSTAINTAKEEIEATISAKAAAAQSAAIEAAATDASTKADAAKDAAIEAAATDASTKADAAKDAAIAAAAEDATAKADAAQAAAIADAASKYLTEITTTKDNGLKVTNKNQIDIDDSVVFVFDCGSSSENI